MKGTHGVGMFISSLGLEAIGMSWIQRKKYVWVVAVGAAAGALASPAQAAVVLNQNFNDTGIFPTNTGITTGGVGDLSSDGGLWVAGSGVTPLPAPKQAPGKASGDQAVQVTRISSGNTTLAGIRSRSYTQSAIPDGRFDYQFSIYRDYADSSMVAAMQQDDHLGNLELSLYIESTGHLFYWHNGTWESPAIVQDIPDQTWATFRGTVDATSGKWSLYLTLGTDPEKNIFSDLQFNTTNLGAINRVTFIPQAPDNTNRTFWVDNMVIKSVPEPATAVLLLLAGGPLVVRRRRRQVAAEC